MNLRHIQPNLYLILLFSGTLAIDSTPEARWAQATAVINDALFVHGGKTDPFNSYSYTSAPNNNDILYLPLSQSFEVASPRWQLLSNSSSPSTFQGPALAWHTLSAFNTSGALLFGGEPGPNSPPPTLDNPDSAVLLDLSSILQPAWYAQATSWAGQPIRRIHHTSATAPSGVVYIIGGQKADGSGIGFSDHYAFDPRTFTFSQLPAENAPPAIYGHVSVMSVDGKLIVFGGASQNSLFPLSKVWSLDTSTDVPAWSQLQVNADSLPYPRRAFAATAIGQGKILIQGGSDADLQSNLDDGWILDISQSPAVWTPVEQLSQVGPRRDHYAAHSNGLVMFGFGYLNSRPAPADLQIFNLSSNTFVSSYTPAPPTASTTRTLPGESGIPTRTATNYHGPSASSSGTANPTTTVGTPSGDERQKKPVVAIAVGVVLGVLGAVAIVVVVILYSRRRQRRGSDDSFLIIDDDENDGSLHANSAIPAATMYSGNGGLSSSRWGNGLLGAAFGIAGTLSAITKSRDTYQRRDMLADEDTRDFGEWYNARRRDGTGGSSFSLRSILGARFRSREPSTYSRGSGSHRQEKTDPFSDGVSLMHDQEPGTLGLETGGRPHSRRETSYLSTSSYSYLDPFVDPVDEKGDVHDIHEYDPSSAANAVSRPPPSLSTIRIVPITSTSGHPLSPLSEHTSNTSLPSNDLTSLFVDSGETSAETVTSHTTLQPTIKPSPSTPTNKLIAEIPRTSTSFPSTIIPASVPLTNVRRSDSWWSKFYRTNFLDRGPTLRSPARSEFLDPSPPPSLDPISESVTRPSADKSAKQKGSDQPPVSSSKLYKADPGNSMTSLQTADTERIERMAGAMDVAQRLRVRSQRTTGSVSSGLSVDTHRVSQDDDGLQVEFGTIPLMESPRVEDPSDTLIPRGSSSTHHTPLPLLPLPLLPLEQKSPAKPSRPPTLPGPPTSLEKASKTDPLSSSYGTNPISSPSVAARVRMYERKLTQDQEQGLPTNTRQREERSPKKSRVSVDYGFVPRPNLFVANPDHRNSRSSDS